MIVMPLRTAFLQAGAEPGDSDLERDLKFAQWIQGRKYQVVDARAQSQVANDLDILFIKEK
jgi:hypothetical protein